ncbi:MAG: aminoglycoside phosphotransferase family protein [Deltaproteobacteria bacterium]
MSSMHADELMTDEALVRRLLAAQFPHWARLPIERVASAGTDNALYRLGPDLVVRLPRVHWAAAQTSKEQRWLPVLAPLLPLELPAPVASGAPGEGYPWHWGVYRWLAGKNATLDRIADARQLALDLAQFIAALQRVDATSGPAAGEHNSFRGVPLAERDVRTRAALTQLHGVLDVAAATAEWEAALSAATWRAAPVWVHGDLQSGNLLAQGGRLCAVIDFGCLGVGDPAVDLIVAWNLLTPEARELLRTRLGVDDATWARGRGWALSVSLVALPYYQHSNPALARIARQALAALLGERALLD